MCSRGRDIGAIIYKEQLMFLRQVRGGGARTMNIGRDAIERAVGPYTQDHPSYLQTWWDWLSGSTLFFWNLPVCYCQEDRDGQRHYLIGEFGSFVQPQMECKTVRDAGLVRGKAVVIRLKNYIEPGEDTRDFLSWTEPCVVCGKTRRGGVGIFSRSFCVGRAGFP